MSRPPAYETLRTKLGEVHDVVRSASLLSWDQQVLMPPRGAEVRAQQLGTLGKLAHELFTSDEIGNLLEELRPYEESLDRESVEASLIRVARRDFEKAVRVPPDLSAEIMRVGAQSFNVWVEARAKSDYESFRPSLERLVELKHRYVECHPPGDELYDTLLDDYEPGMKAAEVRAIFDRLKEVLIPLVESAAPAATPPVKGTFPAAIQRRLSLEIVRRFGFDDTAWRLDEAPHPFAQGLATQDIRITTREPEDSLDGLFATMHECGHGLYEHQVGAELERSPLCHGVSLGLHESQSRMWENLVGRSLPFWRHFFPRLQQVFPEPLAGHDAERWYREVNAVQPSLIRVEADEATYNLHIILRFELEQQLLDESFPLEQLPEAWNRRMWEYLRIEVPDDRRGVLQDTHWAIGSVGYFSTYALGNLISAQLWEHVEADIPDLERGFERGEFAPLRDWLREHVHRYGRTFSPAETLERATGSGTIDPEPYVRYLRRKFEAIYGLPAAAG